MIRVKTLFLILLILFSRTSFSIEDLHQKVFGAKEQLQTLLLDVYEEGRLIGELEASFLNEKLVSFPKMDLLIFFRSILEDQVYTQLSNLNGPVIRPEDLPFELFFDPSELILKLNVPLEYRKPKKLNFATAITSRIKAQAISPAPFSGALTVRAEQTLSQGELQQDFLQSSFDSFVNVKSFVLENRSDYNSSHTNKWSRGDTRLVFDDEQKMVRYQVGDIGNQVVGAQPFRQLGGISVSRNFGLNPYRSNLPSGSQEFNLRTRSQVNTYINGALVKTEFLDPGRYRLDNLPLNNGLNRIVIEAFDELGGKEVFEFQQSSSLTLLNPKESRFDFSIGYEFEEVERERDYLTNEPLVFSTFYQFGFSANKTAAAYFQKQGSFHLSGAEGTWAVPFGLISSGAAYGQNDKDGGFYLSSTYQYTSLGREWSDHQRFAFTYEYSDESFQRSEEFIKNKVSSAFRTQISQPISSLVTVNVGANFADVRDEDNHRYGYELGVSSRLSNRVSLSLLGGRNRDESKVWNEQVYAFLTISFPQRGAYAQTLYNSQNQSTRLTVSNDSLNKINSVKTQASVERNRFRDEVQADLTYLASFADLGVRGDIKEAREGYSNISDTRELSLRYSTTLAFAVDSNAGAIDFTRPINNSFAFLKPDEKFDDPLNVRGVGIYNEASMGPLGNTIYPNMIPYQYREVEVDAAFLPEGVSLEKENFILFPRYRSGHLIKLTTIGEKAVSLSLVDQQQRVISFAVGTFVSSTGEEFDFFTNKNGEAFVNGLSPGKYIVRISEREVFSSINIPESDDVRIELGVVQLKRGL